MVTGYLSSSLLLKMLSTKSYLRQLKISEVKSFQNDEAYNGSTGYIRLYNIFSHLSITVFPLIKATLMWANLL